MKELSLLTLNTVIWRNSPSKLHQKKKILEKKLISVILTLLVLIYLVCIVPESNRVIALPSEAEIFGVGERRERCKVIRSVKFLHINLYLIWKSQGKFRRYLTFKICVVPSCVHWKGLETMAWTMHTSVEQPQAHTLWSIPFSFKLNQNLWRNNDSRSRARNVPDGPRRITFLKPTILGGSKITADGDCSHEIKRRLLLGRKVMTNLDSILKSRNITLPTKIRLVKAMVFPVVVYGCESWNVKKAERQWIDASKLWCWRRLLRVPWLQGTGRPGMLQFMGSQRVRHDRATELNWSLYKKGSGADLNKLYPKVG